MRPLSWSPPARVPLEVAIEFGLKYAEEHELLRLALPRWEAAAQAMGAYREARRRAGKEAAAAVDAVPEVAEARQRCLEAAEALASSCGDVATFEGVEFAAVVAVRAEE